MKAQRRKRSKTKQKQHQRKTPWHLQTKRQEDTSSRNKDGRTSTSPLALGYLSLVPPVTFGHTTACRSPALASSATINFAIKCSALCSTVLRHSPSSWTAVVHWPALMPKALRSSRKHSIHYYFSWPITQPAPSTNSPNITHFGSLVSSMRATNPANKIRLLLKVASMLLFPVL